MRDLFASVQSTYDSFNAVLNSDPSVRNGLIAATAVASLTALSVSIFRRKPKDRVRVNVDAPLGQVVKVQVGEEDEES